jgi:hypothetical protein
MSEKMIPVFNKRIFWDVNFERMELDALATFIIGLSYTLICFLHSA